MKGTSNATSDARLCPTLAALVLLALSSLVTDPLAAAPTPIRKTYFTILLGLEAPYTWQADCLRFTASQLCTLGRTCGSWARSEAAGPETAITFQISFEESGAQVDIDGRARIDDRGKGSSLAGVARANIAGSTINFGLTGRAISKKKCLRLRREWDSQNPPSQPAQNVVCLDRASFGSAVDSPYVLPYGVGRAYRVGQTYCVAGNTHGDQLAYDLMLPMGAPVLAARAGTVREVRDDIADNVSGEDSGVHNHVYIEHDDASTAFYAHLKQDSVLVTVGQEVEAGDQIASSGSSGSDTPLLHFGVYRTYPPSEGGDLPVNFHNSDGPVDAIGGLIQDVFYQAMSY